MSNKRKNFSSSDRSALDITPGVSWIPKDPAELILPYMEKEIPEEKSEKDKRREKAFQVYQKYTDIAEECKRLEDEISNRCKKVVIPLDEVKHHQAIQACERVFGQEGIREITFEMYKTIVKVIADRSDTATPSLEDL